MIAAAAEILLLLFGFLQDRKTGTDTVLLSDAFTGVQDGVTFQAYIYAPQEHATLCLTTNGTDFTLQSVTLTPSRAWAWYKLLCYFAFLAALDLALAL